MAFEKNMNERSEQLNSDVGSIFVPKNISNILAQVSMVANFPDKSSELDFLIRSLEEESRKVDGFKRELPHCMHLLKEAIEALKKERFKRREKVAVMEETEPVNGDGEGDGRTKPSDDISEKKNWMSSAQLWSTPVLYENNFDAKNHYSYVPLRYEKGEGSKRNFSKGGGAFVPFNKPPIIKEEKRGAGAGVGVEPGLTPSAPVADVQSIDLNVKDNSSSSSGFNRPHMHQHKKQRRCWSPDLHKRFVDALLQLGGPQNIPAKIKAATPKQIRELMNVDGLTNDEVKSHLQKYRIHIKKLPWWLQNRYGGSSKRMGPDLGSPQEHFHEGGSTSASVRGGSATKSDNMEDDEDKKPDIHTCKG